MDHSPSLCIRTVRQREIEEGKKKKYGSKPGIEPGTSSTLKKNHTPRPLGLVHVGGVPNNVMI
jgi:hypothetical protein